MTGTDFNKMFVIRRFDKQIVSRIYKELLQLSNMRMTQQKYCIKWKFPDGPAVRTQQCCCCGPNSITDGKMRSLCGQKNQKWVKGLNSCFTGKDIGMFNKDMKYCSASLVIREMQLKP